MIGRGGVLGCGDGVEYVGFVIMMLSLARQY